MKIVGTYSSDNFAVPGNLLSFNELLFESFNITLILYVSIFPIAR